MTDDLPEGLNIGHMQASLEWVLAHTARFIGLITLSVGEGEGFVLIDRGNPVAYVFRHGKRVLKGHGAFDYLRAQPLIDFTFRTYSPDDFKNALEYCRSKGFIPGPVRQDEIPDKKQQKIKRMGGPGKDRQNDTAGAGPEIVLPETPESIPLEEATVGIEESNPAVEESWDQVNQEARSDMERIGHVLLGQMLRLPYVQAVSIFSRGTNILSVGDINLESLVELAEDMLLTAKGISSATDAGLFVHLTLQIPGGNVIIAPYFDEYLCILTTPDINLGQIRKILREIRAGLPAMDENEEI